MELITNSCKEKIERTEKSIDEEMNKIKANNYFLNVKFSGEQVLKILVERSETKLKENFLYKRNRAEKCKSIPFAVMSNSKFDVDGTNDQNNSQVGFRRSRTLSSTENRSFVNKEKTLNRSFKYKKNVSFNDTVSDTPFTYSGNYHINQTNDSGYHTIHPQSLYAQNSYYDNGYQQNVHLNNNFRLRDNRRSDFLNILKYIFV